MRRILIIILCTLNLALNAQLNTDRLTSIGRNALYFEDYVLSIQYFNQVIKVKPYLIDPYYFRAIAKIQLEDYVGAEADLDIVIERNPFIHMAYYARGFAKKRLGKWEEAIADFDNALVHAPDNAVYIINRIEAYDELERYDEALADINFLVRRSPKATELQFEKGRLQLVSKDTVGAFETFDHLVKIDKYNPEAWGARALINIIMEHRDEALEDYNQSIKLKTRNPNAYINRGILNYEKHKYRQALADYDKAIELDSTNVGALFNRALLRNEVGDYHTAIIDLDNVLKIDPSMSEAIYQRGLINAHIGNNREAISDFTSIIERHPNFIPALYARAEMYDRLGDVKKAFVDRDNAYKIKENYHNSQDEADSLSTAVKVAIDEESVIKSIAQLFNTEADEANGNNGIRGYVQNQAVALNNQPNIVLTYYQKSNNDLPIEHYNPELLQQLNKAQVLRAPAYLVSDEIKLSEAMIAYHFASIDELSAIIAGRMNEANLYLARAYDYALVQDFALAIEDFSKAIYIDGQNALAYFSRANIRYKKLEFSVNNEKAENANVQDTYRYEYEMIMRDYDKVIELAPDFAFVWYNRANLLAYQKDYQAAVASYTKAIELEDDLSEAYFNRALTYLLLNQQDKAIADLSKAGELGIYKAYSILKKIQNK
ncbi:MAG: tetratricopeptide repeat protein [Paludibacteraceae bacterium]|nr:tetratricopeptide repeat protein [Paludibacteraceae bacterium]